MKKILGILAGLLMAALLFGTAQESDYIRWDGELYMLDTNPLTYLPDKQGKLFELRLQPFEDPETGETYIPNMSTSNWRGYVATWRVENDRLYLDDVEKEASLVNGGEDRETVYRSILAILFGDNKPVFADWYMGHLIILDGEMVAYQHQGYASVFERYIIATVEKGIVTTSVRMDADRFIEFRQAQFDAYKKTDRYREQLEKFKSDEMTTAQVEQFLFGVETERFLSHIFPENPVESYATGCE